MHYNEHYGSKLRHKLPGLVSKECTVGPVLLPGRHMASAFDPYLAGYLSDN